MYRLKVYSRVMRMLGPDLNVVIGLLLVNAALACLQFFEPILFGWLVDAVSQSSDKSREALLTDLMILVGIWLAIGVSAVAAAMAVSVLSDRLAHRNWFRVMGEFLQHALSLPPSFHSDLHSGQLMKTMLIGSDRMFQTWLFLFRDHLSSLFTIAVLLPLSMVLNWQLGLLLLILMIFLAALITLVSIRTSRTQDEIERSHSQIAGHIQDVLPNVVVLQSFGVASSEGKRLLALSHAILAKQYSVLNLWALAHFAAKCANLLTELSVIVVGTVLYFHGVTTVGEIIAFVGFAGILIRQLEGVTGFVCGLVFHAPVISEFFVVIDSKSIVFDKPNAVVLTQARGAVRFNKVTFAYPDGELALIDVDFEIAPGQTVALVGASGAGKSTVISLLQRLWDPLDGTVSLDGYDLRNLKLDSIQRNIAVVSQDCLLFNRSIRDNLLVGKPDATQDQLDRACDLVNAREFILKQSDGYDTMIGERGVNLSGGQRQRLTIARALLKDAPVLILDEATSAQDAVAEAHVQLALKTLATRRTTFIVAHRLSALHDVDEILVFERGRLVERGDFSTLVDAEGHFAALVRSQLSSSKSHFNQDPG